MGVKLFIASLLLANVVRYGVLKFYQGFRISHNLFIRSDKFDLLTIDMSPNPGPSLDSVYVPGRPGADWTDEEIETTRYRVLQAIHPDWEVQHDMFGNKIREGQVSENRIMRLVFHDCVKYTGKRRLKKSRYT